VTLQPTDIPEGVIADFGYEPCSQGVGNNVTSERQKLFAITNGSVVITGLPQRATSAGRFVHCLGTSGFGSTNDIPQVVVFQLHQPMKVIGHHNPSY
jgi:hypothetical protein